MAPKYDVIHEGEFIENLLNTFADRLDDAVGTVGNKNNVSSITRTSKDFILTFPVFVSNTMDAKTMMLIAKALERKYASTLLVLFNSFNDLTDATVRQYIKKFHINLGDEFGTRESAMLEFNEAMTEYIKKNNPRFTATINEHKKNIMKDMNNLDFVLPESVADYDISGEILNEGKNKTTPNYNKEYKKLRNNVEQQTKTIQSLENQIKRLQGMSFNSNKQDKDFAKNKYSRDQLWRDEDLKLNKERWGNEYELKKNRDSRDQSKVDAEIKKLELEKQKLERELSYQRFGNAELTPGDIRKANEMTPSLITVNYYPTKEAQYPRSFMVGVKTKVYPIESETIVEKLAKADRNRGILNLVRATTREISFVKDYLLMIDTLKKDAKRAARNKESMKEWKRLENRARLVKINNLTGMNLAQAITTVAITKYEAEQLLDNYDIDIMDASVARYIMRKYSLLGLIITDPEYELIDMMFDGDDMIEQMTNKDLSMSRSDTEDIVTLLGKVL